MAHLHAQAHLVRRQRNRDDEEEEEEDHRPTRNQEQGVVTIISVDVVTAEDTNTGRVVWVTRSVQAPKTLVAPAIRSRPSSAEDEEPEPTSKPAAASRRPASTHESQAKVTQTRSIQEASTLMLATRSPIPSAAGTTVAGIASATAAATSAAASSTGEADGMSTGAKAGLALGILLIVCALLTGVLILYRRKKNQVSAGMEKNEKIDLDNAPPPPPPQVQAAAHSVPSIRTNRTMSTAPRLSLRPVTQFDPTFSEQRKSGANLLAVAAAGGAAAQPQNRDLANGPPSSAWEQPGAANSPTTNPFKDPEAQNGPAANPFGNNAALDTHQAALPDSPPNASPLHSTQPSKDFANPARAIAAAEMDPVATPGMMASAPPAGALTLPPAIAANASSLPPSPTWTEDLPASPGPAPTGPPPVAGGITQSPAPGPNNVHRVQLDFKPSMQDELDLHAGQLVRMLHEYDDGWALCIRMDRSQQGVVPRTCLSKHPVKPRNGPPRQGLLPPGMRGQPIRPPMGPNGAPQPRPLSPASGSRSPQPTALPYGNDRMSPGSRSMSPGPHQMTASQMHEGSRSNNNAPRYGPPRGRSNSNAPYAGPPRSMSPGPYGGGPQMAPPLHQGRPRSNSASQAGNPRRGPAPGPSPMNPNTAGLMPPRKPVPGMAL